MPILSLLGAMLIAALLSLALTPLDFRIASRLGAIDVPRDGRRMHKRPIPRLGGLSIFFCFLSLSLIYNYKIAPDLFYALSGAILIVLIGVLDDQLALPPALKFFVQCAAVCISSVSGGTFSVWSIGKYSIDLGILSFPVTFVFMLAMINAHNFIDGLDGLCAGVSLAESLGLGLYCLNRGSIPYQSLSFLLGGTCIGFLPYNIRGAKLFMGDTGSTFLGYTLAVIAVRTVENPLTLFLLFALPLSDLVFAILRRLAHGKSPFLPDRSHLHHLLCDRVGAYAASKILCFASALAAALAILLGK